MKGMSVSPTKTRSPLGIPRVQSDRQRSPEGFVKKLKKSKKIKTRTSSEANKQSGPSPPWVIPSVTKPGKLEKGTIMVQGKEKTNPPPPSGEAQKIWHREGRSRTRGRTFNVTLAPNYANDAKTFLKHFSDCLFYFCFTCADSIIVVIFAQYSKSLLTTHEHVDICSSELLWKLNIIT